MATSGRGTGMVGYNIQAAVDTEHHLILAHEVTNAGHDRTQLAGMATQAKQALDTDELNVVADRGYFKSEEIQACEEAGITTDVPKPRTSGNQARGQFGRDAFRCHAADDEYECPAGERLIRRMTSQEKGKSLHLYWASNCKNCAIRARCTSGIRRKMSRWEHEALLEQVEARLGRHPQLMRVRRSTVEHPFGTLKAWMGSTHFLTRTLPRVNTEMSLHVLAYNSRRMLNLVGAKPLIEAIRASALLFTSQNEPKQGRLSSILGPENPRIRLSLLSTESDQSPSIAARPGLIGFSAIKPELSHSLGRKENSEIFHWLFEHLASWREHCSAWVSKCIENRSFQKENSACK